MRLTHSMYVITDVHVLTDPHMAPDTPDRPSYERALNALRAGDAGRAEYHLRAIQSACPGEVNSLRLLGVALLAQNKTGEAAEMLEQAVAAAPDFAQARTDLARVYRRTGRSNRALTELCKVLRVAPSSSVAWMVMGDVLVDLERFPEARNAFRRSSELDPAASTLALCQKASSEGRPMDAERGFKKLLVRDASHVGALCGLAAVYLGSGLLIEAQRLLQHALTQTAHSPRVLSLLGQVLLEAGRLVEAEATVRRVLQIDPRNLKSWVALGAINGRLMRPEAALAAYQEGERIDPEQRLLHLSIGHVLKSLGRRSECERVYHECIARQMDPGEAYWSLADLKNYRFTDSEVLAMDALIASASGDDSKTAQLHFALGRAFEQRGNYGKAFENYDRGNRWRRTCSPFDFDAFESKCRRITARLNADFFESIRGNGCSDAAPIFVVGLPRSGSTLVEQILASHSCVEGTMELPNILNYVRELEHLDRRGDAYPESVQAAPRAVFDALGRRYIEETRPLRTGSPRFIDKLPNNFIHIGLIHAILPNATIIDVRRHPMDACFSCFKQYFAVGQSFTYDLEGLGRYYRQYLALMDHWDRMLPGKVLHLPYEELVAAPEVTIRGLLGHCGLDFEPSCLSFHETRRAIRTASSEQVRQPLYSSGVGQWRRFESQLEPLRRSLGGCLDRFPVPR